MTSESQRDTSRRGTFYGLGVGPGDPELLTLRAHQLLTRVPVVFAPAHSGGGRGYALQIVGPLLDEPRQRVELLTFAMSRDRTAKKQAWKASARRIAEVSAGGDDAVFVTEGDPLTYSTFAHLLTTLRQQHPDVPIQIVPGVTSFAAASAAALQPLVDADQRLAVIPATYGLDELPELLQSFDVVVLMKVNTVLPELLARLEQLGLAERALFARRVGRPDQEIHVGLHDVQALPTDYFSLIIVHTERGDST